MVNDLHDEVSLCTARLRCLSGLLSGSVSEETHMGREAMEGLGLILSDMERGLRASLELYYSKLNSLASVS
jgi:hypothetical protein